MMKRPLSLLVLVAVVIALLVFGLVWLRKGGPGSAGAGNSSGKVLLYCAAGLKQPVQELADEFEKRYGVTVEIQYGGSGTLLANLQVARTGDLYIAGDSSYTAIAREKGAVEEILPLAHMRPVIGVARGNPKGIRGVSDLLSPDLRVALASPDAASIGKQTRILVEKTGDWEALEKRVRENGVFHPTVNEVANAIKLGSVDAGILWDATANQYPEIEAIHVPDFDAAAKQVEAGVLAWTKQPATALRLARFLNSRESNPVFRKFGFEPVEGDIWEWAPEITFYCGSVNRRAVEDIIKAFENREGVTVNTVYNGCGILTAQMRTINQGSGAGFPDVYMACDRYYLETVKNWFQEDADISDARIVIAAPKGNPKNLQSLKDLTAPGIRVAVGQPEQCTIGALTRIMLEKEGLYDPVMANVVTQAASSAQLVPAVLTKSVDAAIAYNTDTRAEADQIESIAIDSPNALAIQPFSIAKSSEHKYLGRRLFDRVRVARGAFEEAGFHFRGDSPAGDH